MANVLITGGAGFIGSHTADELIRLGHKVRILDLLDPQIHSSSSDFPKYTHPEVQCIRGDVRNLDAVAAALDNIDAVYHFAALTGVGQSMYEMKKYVDINCTGTATVIEAIVKCKQQIKRLVLSSSRAIYGEGTYQCDSCGTVYPNTRQRDDMEQGCFEALCPTCNNMVRPMPTSEDRPAMPTSTYGRTKQHQEDYCIDAAKTFNLPTVCLRYFNVYGRRQSLKNPYTGIVSIFYNRIMKGRPISLYEGGNPLRDFVHVSDVVQANVLALDADLEPGTCINVGTGRDDTITHIAQTLAGACGRSVDLQDLGEFRVGDIRACYADLKRASTLLKYTPQTSLRQGLDDFVAWAAEQEIEDLYEQTVKELKAHHLFGKAKGR